MKNVILATSINYKWNKIIPFIDSLEKNVEEFSLFVFTNQKYKYKSSRIQFIYKEDSKASGFNNSNNYRYLWYADFIKNNPNIENVLLADIRDVIFQNDPFEHISDNILAAQEDNTIGNCQFNSAWIRDLYGEEMLNELSNKSILCSGTILGSRERVISLLEFVINEIETHGPRLDGVNSNTIIDQGVYNYYCHLNPDTVKIVDNETGPILTAGYKQNFKVTKNAEVINENDEAFSIVHQHDRFNWLLTMLNERYNKKSKLSRSLIRLNTRLNKY